MKYYIYILYSEKSGIYYVGYTSNIENRLHQHNITSTDSFTSKHRPWTLKSLFQVGDSEGETMRIEKFIKKQKSRLFLEKLCEEDFKPTGALAQLVRVPYVRD